MNTVEFQYGTKVLHLYCNGSAMFAIQELDSQEDDQPDVLERMMENSPEGYRLTCEIAHILAQQGELCRRYLQYETDRIPEARELLLLLSPIQMVALRTAVFRAISDGYGQATDGEGDIDTGLAELEKKRPSAGQNI